jgi:hypothetical protein
MRRIVSATFALALLVGSTLPAAAAQPARNCPNDHSNWMKVDRDGWWANSVAGFGIAGITVYVGDDPANGFDPEFDAFAVDFGFADGQALFDFILGEQWDDIDRNGDGLVCMKAKPINPANPGFFFGAIDNRAH